MNCIICRGDTETIGSFDGATSNLYGLFSFDLLRCRMCAHVQKRIDETYLSIVSTCYSNDYGLTGSKINQVNEKFINRDIFLSKAIASILGLAERPGALLDYGCGRGSLLAAFGSELPGWCRVGYELNAVNSKRITDSGAMFIHGQVNLIEQQFDLILLVHVLEHITNPLETLKELSSLLTPNGYLVVIVPCFERVHTDLFFYEHCSHFTSSTLHLLVSSIGFQVVDTLQSTLAPIEIGVICQRTSPDGLEHALNWSKNLPIRLRSLIDAENLNSQPQKVGLFGVGGAGLWLSQVISSAFGFFVDDDKNKQGKLHLGKPIVSVEAIPIGSTVFVAFNNPIASTKMKMRLQTTRPDVHFVDFP